MLFVVLIVVVFLIDFDSPRLGRALLAEVSARTGVKTEADGFRLNLWRGLRLDGFRFATDSPSGKLTVRAAGLALDEAPTALQGLRSEGDLRTGEIVLGGINATEGSGKL